MMMGGLTLAVITICCFWKVFVALEHYGSGGVGKEKATRRCEKNIWTWKTKGKVTRVAYKKKLTGKWSCLGLICRVGRTGLQRKDIMCFEDCEMAAIAKHHFEKNSMQTEEIAIDERMNLDSPPREMINQEQAEGLEKPFSYIQVLEVVKRMKRGKGVGIDKIGSEMLVGGGEVLWRI